MDDLSSDGCGSSSVDSADVTNTDCASINPYRNGRFKVVQTCSKLHYNNGTLDVTHKTYQRHFASKNEQNIQTNSKLPVAENGGETTDGSPLKIKLHESSTEQSEPGSSKTRHPLRKLSKSVTN